MSRRFSDEPINLIHRIPTPEQLSAARPVKRSFGQVLVESGAACVRGMAGLFTQIARVGRVPQDSENVTASVQEPASEPVRAAASRCSVDKPERVMVRTTDTAQLPVDGRVNPADSAPVTGGVQPEEVAELRAFLLRQQQDIARLSSQIQELKSLVVSQQQVLGFLGKELEATTLSSMASGVASAPVKRNRQVREKAALKDKPVPGKEAPAPSQLSY